MLIVVRKETKVFAKDNLGNRVADPVRDGKFLYEPVIQDESIDVFEISKIRPYTDDNVSNENTKFSMISIKGKSHEVKVEENWSDLTKRVNALRGNGR